MKKENKELPALLREFRSNIHDLEQAINEATNYWNNDNNLTEDFEKALKEYIK